MIDVMICILDVDKKHKGKLNEQRKLIRQKSAIDKQLRFVKFRSKS